MFGRSALGFLILMNLCSITYADQREQEMKTMNEKSSQTLIFVYNADSGLIDSIFDFTHKIFSPKTYPCNLCAITYGNLGMKKEWKDFLEDLPYKKIFLHKDQFRRDNPEWKDIALPAVFVQNGTRLQELISADEINIQKDIPQLKKLLLDKLEGQPR